MTGDPTLLDRFTDISMYQVNSPRVVHETLDGETIIIDTQTGLYYTVAGHASAVWAALANGVAVEQISGAYRDAGLSLAEAVQAYAAQLEAAELLRPAPDASASSGFVIPMSGESGSLLVLHRHADMQELIELDPIHEVDPSQGWPMRNQGDAA